MSHAMIKKTTSNKPLSKTAAATRQRIIVAARAEFGEKGIECATTRGIAERAGCNEVTLFRHFESKQKLLATVVQDTSEEFTELCSSPTDMSGELKTDLTRYATVYNESMESCEGMARALIGEGRRRPTLTKELIGDVLSPFHQSLSNYLKSQVKAGKVRPDVDTDAFAELFTATLMGGVFRRGGGLSAMEREQWIQQTVAIQASGIETSEG